jgi:hypothetical protein
MGNNSWTYKPLEADIKCRIVNSYIRVVGWIKGLISIKSTVLADCEMKGWIKGLIDVITDNLVDRETKRWIKGPYRLIFDDGG